MIRVRVNSNPPNPNTSSHTDPILTLISLHKHLSELRLVYGPSSQESLCQMGVRWCQMTSNGVRWCQVVAGGVRWYPTVSDGAR